MWYHGRRHRRWKAVPMVVGVHKSLEEGRMNSYAELRDRFGLAGPDLERVLDRLVERGRLKPVLFRRVRRRGARRSSAPRARAICAGRRERARADRPRFRHRRRAAQPALGYHGCSDGRDRAGTMRTTKTPAGETAGSERRGCARPAHVVRRRGVHGEGVRWSFAAPDSAAADMTTGPIYGYFSGKEALFDAVVALAADELRPPATRASRTGSTSSLEAQTFERDEGLRRAHDARSARLRPRQPRRVCPRCSRDRPAPRGSAT